MAIKIFLDDHKVLRLRSSVQISHTKAHTCRRMHIHMNNSLHTCINRGTYTQTHAPTQIHINTYTYTVQIFLDKHPKKWFRKQDYRLPERFEQCWREVDARFNGWREQGKRQGAQIENTYRYTYIHTCRYAYIHIDIHTYISINIHTYRYTYIHVDIHTHMSIYIHTYRYAYASVYVS
jgi:hypothetical protein